MSVRPEVLAGLVARASQTAVLVGAAVLVSWRLPTAEQGYFWAIGGLGALVQVAELGLTQVVLQTAAHLRASGDDASLPRFWRSAKVLAGLLAPFAAVVTLLAGFALFSSANADAAVSWQGPWFAFVAALGAAQALTAGIGYVEGAVSAADSWRFQARLEIGTGLLLLAALASGAGLWSLALQALARLVAIAAWLALRRAQFPAPAREGFGAGRWRKEVWPFQWRLAVTGITTFLIYRAFTPIVLAGMGAEAAARFGLSLAVMGSWLAFTVAWPSTQIARVGLLTSQGKVVERRRVFRRMLGGSTALAAAGAVLIMGALWLLGEAGIPFAQRSAGLAATAMLLASGVIHHMVLCAAILLRSERMDPLLPYSIAGSIITACALWFSTGQGQLEAVALAYLLCSAAGLAMAFHVFRTRVPAWFEYLRP